MLAPEELSDTEPENELEARALNDTEAQLEIEGEVLEEPVQQRDGGVLAEGGSDALPVALLPGLDETDVEAERLLSSEDVPCADCNGEGEPVGVAAIAVGVASAVLVAQPVAVPGRTALPDADELPVGDGDAAGEREGKPLGEAPAEPACKALLHAVSETLAVAQPLFVRASDTVCNGVDVPAP